MVARQRLNSVLDGVFMRKFIGTLAALAGAVAFAAAGHAGLPSYNSAGHPAAHQPVALSKTFSTKAKVSYFYTRGIGTDRSKNVSDFQHPSTEIYCMKPSITVDFSQDEPQVSIEWGYSSGFALQAYWIDVSVYTDCPSGYLEVTTYDFNAGGYPVLSDNVAFNMILG